MPIDRSSFVPETAIADASVERLAREHRVDIANIEALDLGSYSETAQLVLVIIGEQPAVDIWLYPRDVSPEKAQETLVRAGLVVRQTQSTNEKGRTITKLFVARTEADADALLAVEPDAGLRTEHERYARLMGFPQTAIDAFVGRTEKMTPAAMPKALRDAEDDPNQFFGIAFSKAHWKEEIAWLQRRRMMIKKYAPKLYEKLTAE
jgi:hypothetical protein